MINRFSTYLICHKVVNTPRLCYIDIWYIINKEVFVWLESFGSFRPTIHLAPLTQFGVPYKGKECRQWGKSYYCTWWATPCHTCSWLACFHRHVVQIKHRVFISHLNHWEIRLIWNKDRKFKSCSTAQTAGLLIFCGTEDDLLIA